MATIYGNMSATSPKDQYIQSLQKDVSGNYAMSNIGGNQTVIRKKDNYAFSNEADFLKDVGDSKWGDYKFDTEYKYSPSLPKDSYVQSITNQSNPVQPIQPRASDVQQGRYSKAYSDYIASLAPNPMVSKARQDYEGAVAERDKSVVGFEGQGRGIPTTLVRGQQEKYLRQTQPELARLQNQIGIVADEQSALQNQNRARAEFEGSLYENILGQERYEDQQRFEREKFNTSQLLEREKLQREDLDRQIKYFFDAEKLGLDKQKLGIEVGKFDLDKARLLLDQSKEEFDRAIDLRKLGIEEQKLLQEQGVNFEDTLKLNQQFLQQSKDFITIRDSYARVRASAENPSAAGDLALIFNYMKMLDPGSVVREGEFATAQNSASVPDMIRNQYNKVLRGERLNDNTRKDFVDRAARLYDSQAQLQKQNQDRYRNLGSAFSNVDTGLAVPDLTSDLGSTGSSISGLTQKIQEAINSGYNSAQIIYQLKQSSPDLMKQIGQAQQQGYKPDEIIDHLMGGANKTSLKGDTKTIDKIASAIGQFESGGNYKAMGPKTRTGDRAYGKYQVMGANIPSWTKEALGKSLTPQQFLNDPKAQDAVAKYKMGKIFAQYKTVEDVASVWFSGRPVAKAGNAKDVIGTSVPKYVTSVKSLFNKLG